MRLKLAPRVERDLDEILAYIALDSPERAVTFVQEIREQFVIIARNPSIFRLRRELGGNVRVLAYGKYLIIFRDLDTEVEIRRVVHGMRSLRRVRI